MVSNSDRKRGHSGFIKSRMSPFHAPVSGRRFAPGSDRAEKSAALHDAAKSGRSVAGGGLVSAADHDDGSASTEGETSPPPRAAGRHRHQRLRSTSHQPLLCLATKKGGKARAKVRRLLSPLSQVGSGLRHGESPLPGGPGQPRATARLRRLPPVADRSASQRRSESGGRGRWIRQRSQPRVGPRRVEDSVADPGRAWPTTERRTCGTLSQTDETPSPRKSLRTALASGNRLLDDQTPQWRSRQRPHLLATLPASAAQNPHSQHQHS